MSRPRDEAPNELPQRLIDRADGEGESEGAALLKKFARLPGQLPSEEAVWNRTLARLVREGPRHRSRLVLATACGVVLGVAGTTAFLHQTQVSPPRFATAPAEHAAAVAQQSPLPSRSPGQAPIPSPGEAASGQEGSGRGDSRPQETPRIQLTSKPIALPVGPAELIGEAEVDLSPEGYASATAEPRAAVVDLGAGTIALHVEKRNAAADRRFDVRAGGYRFTVLGTRFEVARQNGGGVRLSVTEGRVGVFQGERRLAVVAAGGAWSSPDGDAAPAPVKPSSAHEETTAPEPPPTPAARAVKVAVAEPASAPAMAAPPALTGTPVVAVPAAPPVSSPPAPAAVPATAPPPAEPPAMPPPPPVAAPSPTPSLVPSSQPRAAPASSCVPGARGDARQLLACYLNEARGSGLTAEVALYEAARLRRDTLTDLTGALDLLREHRRRFPDGTLNFEVRLSMAELLPKLGRYREALTDIDGLLDGHTGAERRGELLLLRGHVLREGFQDWANAERAYARAAETRGGDGRAADPAAFWRAVCLESLGRKDEALRAYSAYLARPKASLREQAEPRLRALEREHSGK